MKITLEVALADGSKHDVTAGFADIIALEQKFDMDASDLATKQRAVWLAFLAYNALRRAGKTTATFEEFQDQIDDLTPVDSGNG